MGFTTGFLGGVTLTYSVLYLSVYAHRQNRTHQSLLLRQQARLLNSTIDPPEPEYEPPAYRIEQAGLGEQLKDGWNREIESLVRKAQTTDWEAVRIRWENSIGDVWQRIGGPEKSSALEQKIKHDAQELSQVAREQAQVAGQKVKEGAQDLGQKVQDYNQELGKKVRDADIAQKVKDGAYDLEQNLTQTTKELAQKAKEDAKIFGRSMSQGAEDLGQKASEYNQELIKTVQDAHIGQRLSEGAHDVQQKLKHDAQELSQVAKDNAQVAGQKVKQYNREVGQRVEQAQLGQKIRDGIAATTQDAAEIGQVMKDGIVATTQDVAEVGRAVKDEIAGSARDTQRSANEAVRGKRLLEL